LLVSNLGTKTLIFH